MSESASSVSLRLGRYRHYKGGQYVVLGLARHSETEEPLVVYRPDYGDRDLWVRPLTMFMESVTVAGESVPRFAYVGPVVGPVALSDPSDPSWAAPSGTGPSAEEPNLFDTSVATAAGEVVESRITTGRVRIERIISHGQASPPGFWYDQPDDEWVAVLSGWGEIAWADGRTARLAPGETVFLPAGVRHRVAATSPDEPTIWLAVFTPPESEASDPVVSEGERGSSP